MKAGDDFLLDPDNEAFAAGASAKLPPGGLGCILPFMSIFVLVGLFIAGDVARQWVRFVRLSTDYAETQGQVVELRIESDEGATYYVSYRFVADDRIYTEEEPVRKELYHSLDEGQSLLVRYARGDPAVSTVEPGRVGGLLAITAFCLVWDGVVFTFSWYLVREIRKRRRLARRGRQIAGEVLGCDPDRDSDGDLWLTVRFGFHSPQTGRWIEGKGSHTRKDLEGKPLPPQGTPVKVLYLDDKTFMML